MKKLLLVSDSPFLTTGFGTLARRLGYYFHLQDNIEITHCGISDPREGVEMEFNGIKIPWKVYKYHKNYEFILKKFKPDAIIIISDIWKAKEFTGTDIPKIFVAHIEGEPLPTKIQTGNNTLNCLEILMRMDYIIPAGPFAFNTIADRLKTYMSPEEIKQKMPMNIPDCIDIGTFKPMKDRNLKKDLFGLNDDTFLIGWFGRQNCRKGLPYVIEAFSKLKIKNKKLYLHTALNDIYGWNVLQLIEDYGVSEHVILNQRLTVAKGIPTDEMAQLYNAMDITVQPSAGEGFGLTTAESLACGNAMVINDYSELQRFTKVTFPIKPAGYYVEPRTNIRRAVTDIKALVEAIEFLYHHPDFREKLGNSAVEEMKKYSVRAVGTQWIEFLDKHIPSYDSIKSDLKYIEHNNKQPVSIIIPTKNNLKDLSRCLESIRNNTVHPCEIIIVDTESDQNVQKYYGELIAKNPDILKIVNREGAHNYSDECNIGVEHAKYKYICIMNDDVFVRKYWLNNMMAEMKRGIGVVGPKLLFEDGRIQHAGVKFIDPNFSHPYIGKPSEYPLANFTRDVTGVTGACFLTTKNIYKEVKGMDIELDVECQDYDYCLKVHRSGHRIVYAPSSEAIHLVASNRGNKWPKRILANREEFKKRWADYLFRIKLENKGPEELLISIIVPIHNCSKYIEPFIRSVRNQTYENFEIILVDDGSTDDSRKIINRFEKILPDVTKRLFKHKSNANVARMRGYEKANGNYIIFSDVDSLWRPQLLETYITALIEHPEASYTYADHKREGFINDTWKTLDFSLDVLTRTNFINMISLIRKEHFPGLDPSLERAQDWDLWLTMAKDNHYGHHIKEILYTLYMRKDGISGRGEEDWQNIRRKVLDKYFYDIPIYRDGVEEFDSPLSLVLCLKDREKMLRKMLKSLAVQNDQNFEVCICDYHSTDVDFKKLQKEYKFPIHVIQNDDQFTRSGGLNKGFEIARYDKIFFTDADMLFPRNFVQITRRNIQKNQAWAPICRNESSKYNSDKDGWRIWGFGNFGLCREDFMKIKQWPQNIRDWGGEDNIMAWKCEIENIYLLRYKLPEFIHQDHDHGYITVPHEKVLENIQQAKKEYLNARNNT